MKKIILKIFLSFNIYAIIFSKCEGKDEEECVKEIDKGKYPDLCCYYKKVEGVDGDGSNFCKTVPYSSYYQNYKKEYIDDTLYDVICSDSSIKTYTLERCGNTFNENPSKKECKKFSTYVDSCCYYSGENNSDDPQIEKNFVKGCYWLGSKYEGSIFWAGARLECSFKFLKYSLFTLFNLIILL